MDVSKAKTVIIVLLVAFNIFMLVSNLTFNDAQSVSKETLRNVEMILEQRGITLECDIPAKSGDSHRLEYDRGGLDQESIAVRLLGGNYEAKENSIYFKSSKNIIFLADMKFVYTDSMVESSLSNDFDRNKASEAAYRFIEACGLLDGKYVLDKFKKKDDGCSVLYYIEQYEGQLLFDNYFSIELNSNGVVRLEYQKYKIKGYSAENIEQPEVYQTLLSYFNRSTDIVITSIDSGYKLMDEASEDVSISIEPLPVWRVIVKGEAEPIYISPHDISL